MQDNSEWIQHKLSLMPDKTEQGQETVKLGNITVSVIFRSVASISKSIPQGRLCLVGGARPLPHEGVARGQGSRMRNLRKKRKQIYHSEGQWSCECG